MLTVSVGAALADSASAPDALIDAADQALSTAKRPGRKCVRVSDLAAAIASA